MQVFVRLGRVEDVRLKLVNVYNNSQPQRVNSWPSRGQARPMTA